MSELLRARYFSTAVTHVVVLSKINGWVFVEIIFSVALPHVLNPAVVRKNTEHLHKRFFGSEPGSKKMPNYNTCCRF